MSVHESGEMYLEAILVLSKKNGFVRSIDVSEYLGYSKPSVSRAVGILKNGNYITVDKDGSLALTETGRTIAEKIFERHTVLTKMLVRLGVSVETLDRFGAVSAETAAEMAAGVRRVCGSDLGISFTGVAGPNRDDRGNEVGTVYVGVATSEKTYVNLLELAGDRDTIRRLAVEQGMEQLLTLLQEKGE